MDPNTVDSDHLAHSGQDDQEVAADSDAPNQVAAKSKRRQSFLPIKTNTFDRVFISVLCLVAIHLLWMRFLEATFPLWIATVLSLILSYMIVRYG